MAEYLLREKLKGTGIEGIEVESRGIAVAPDFQTPQVVKDIMSEEGIDISSHKPRPLDHRILQQADLILVMSGEHKRILEEYFPSLAKKICLLKDYAGLAQISDGPDIPDPIGQSKTVYQACAREIGMALDKVIQRWKKEGINSV